MPNSAQRQTRTAPRAQDADPVGSRSAATRQSILDSARELFSAHGYAATSISEIVTKAGTSVGLPYYHFGSKKQIFFTLWSEYQQSQEARTRDAVLTARRGGESGKELLLAGTRAYMWGAWEARDMVPMLHSTDAPSGFDAAIRNAGRRWERQNRELLSEYDPRRVSTATLMFAGALRAVCLRLPSCRRDAEAADLIEQSLLLLSGLLGVLDI